jgi:antitoxin ChpS
MAGKHVVDPDTQAAVQAFSRRVAKHYDVEGVILYGSRVRQSRDADSDADVAVLLRGHRGRFVATQQAMADLAYDVLLETGIRIQPLPIWKGEWRKPDSYSNPRLLHNIAREGIRL